MREPTVTHDHELVAALRTLVTDRTCIVGVGNRLSGDDGAGPSVIDARRPGVPGVWIDAGIAPENYLEPIARSDPDVVLIVDAVAFGGVPGEVRLLDPDDLDSLAVSTHASSLRIPFDYLRARTGARLQVLAIQPESTVGQDRLSGAVQATGAQLGTLLSDLTAAATEVVG